MYILIFITYNNIFSGGVLLNYTSPVQLPLHEPYFDLTPIKVMHTKIVIPKYLFNLNK